LFFLLLAHGRELCSAGRRANLGFGNDNPNFVSQLPSQLPAARKYVLDPSSGASIAVPKAAKRKYLWRLLPSADKTKNLASEIVRFDKGIGWWKLKHAPPNLRRTHVLWMFFGTFGSDLKSSHSCLFVCLFSIGKQRGARWAWDTGTGIIATGESSLKINSETVHHALVGRRIPYGLEAIGVALVGSRCRSPR